jgi:mannose-6-phosphate isomerase-like protein (cupin superfamily)
MYFKKERKDIPIIDSFCCGSLEELFNGREIGNNLSIVIGNNIQPTKGHYHTHNDEIYICLKGSMTVRIYSPISKKIEDFILEEDETIFIGRNTHHKIISASVDSKFIAISNPFWEKEYEFLSDKIL